MQKPLRSTTVALIWPLYIGVPQEIGYSPGEGSAVNRIIGNDSSEFPPWIFAIRGFCGVREYGVTKYFVYSHALPHGTKWVTACLLPKFSAVEQPW